MRWLTVGRDFLRGALRQLPVETVLVASAAFASIAVVHGLESVWVGRVVLAALLATPVAFAAHGLGRARSLAAGVLATLAALAAVTVGMPDRLEEWHRPIFAWPFGLTLLAAVLSPFIAAAGRFTTFVRRFFEQSTTWGLIFVAASAALGVVEFALTELFGISWRLGADLHFVLAGAFVLVWLHTLLPEEGGGRMPDIWRRLATAVGAPFVTVMVVILACYEGVVLAQGELPRNMLSPLIMTAGFVGYLCTLVIAAVTVEPVGSSALAPADPHRFTRRFSVRLVRAFPLVMLALLPMAGWALWARIGQYGLTPFRVVRLASLLCLAALSVVGAWRWLRKRPPLGWEVPAVIALVALACAFGPVSAVRLSVASQAARLSRALDAAGVSTRVVPSAPAAAPRALPKERVDEVRETLVTLGELGGEGAVRRVLSGETATCADGWSGVDECLKKLGIFAGEEAKRWASFEATGPWMMDGAELHLVDLSKDSVHPGAGLGLVGTSVVLREHDVVVARAPLDAMVAGWRTADGVMEPRVVRLVRDDGSLAGQLAIRHLEVSLDEKDVLVVSSLNGVWLPR